MAEFRFLEEVTSTNDLAKAMARDGAPHGSAVLAWRQTAGRGRLGRAFSSPEGGVYLSVVLRPEAPPERLLHLTPVLAVAACDAVEAVSGVRPGCKWVNDLMLDGRKLAGILVEISGGAMIAGIGVNVNTEQAAFPPELRDAAVSLRQMTGKTFDREKLGRELADRFAAACLTAIRDQKAWMARYRVNCLTLGQTVETTGPEPVIGTAEDVADDGSLLIRTEEGLRSVQSGEASLRKT